MTRRSLSFTAVPMVGLSSHTARMPTGCGVGSGKSNGDGIGWHGARMTFYGAFTSGKASDPTGGGDGGAA